MRRVVVTGVGAVSPCGNDTETTWNNVVQGRSGIGRITAWDPEGYASQIAGECVGYDPEQYIEKRRLREMARFIHLAMGAADQAFRSSGFEPTDEQRERTGTLIGVGMCGMDVVEAQHEVLMKKGPRRVSPYFIPSAIANLAPGQVSMKFGLKGPSFTTTSACSSGAHALGEAMNWIRRGEMDAALAGGAEACVTPLSVAGFAQMRALSKRNDEPERASRPFDAGRDGFVIAEGAAILMLEEREAAIARGANILAEIIGYGATADAYHLTQPAPNGEGAQRAMRAALKDAKLNADQIGYINAHGTSTPTGDVQELEAIRAAIGSSAAVSSTKSVTGHLLGAAGGLEGALSTLAISRGVLPPTANLEDPDPATEGLDIIGTEARETRVEYALSNSFGFGGTNVSLIFARHS